MSLTHKLDHAASAIARLLEQLKGKPKIEALLSVLSAEAQAAEDALWSIYVGYWIGSAVGAQLDVLGRIAGYARNGDDDVSDTVYRTKVLAKFLANSSSGTLGDIAGVLETLWDGLITWEYLPKPQAGFIVRVTDPVGDVITFISRYLPFLRVSHSAGVRAILETHGDDEADLFSFFDGAGLGFDDGTGTVGGTFAAASDAS